MGFPVGYTEVFIPTLFIHTLTFFTLLRKILFNLFNYMGLSDFLEPGPIALDQLPPPLNATTIPRITVGPTSPPLSAIVTRELLPLVRVSKEQQEKESCAVCLYEFSSGEEISEGARALPPGNKLQPTSDAKENTDQNQSDIDQEAGINQSRSSLSQVEQSSQTKPLSIEVDGHKEGESAPSERQVSPDKLYRAALLRSRFADTILKAQEKTLEKGEKRDPEKLRLEREELERRQREEKARLQAEARAAEEARKKAEAEAAAEAKRKRELEREAARLALQKMEKTVDINENCQFMEDLEMLSAAPPDDLSSFMGDTSPNDSQNGGLGSFRFRGNSNPLEQLGLYRKDDDEEEEEVEAPQDAPDPAANDVEEGEID